MMDPGREEGERRGNWSRKSSKRESPDGRARWVERTRLDRGSTLNASRQGRAFLSKLSKGFFKVNRSKEAL